MSRHPGLTVSNLLNCTRIENAHEVCKKAFFIEWLLNTQQMVGQSRCGLVRAINPPYLPIKMTKLKWCSYCKL